MRLKSGLSLNVLQHYGFEKAGEINKYGDNPFDEDCQLSFLHSDNYSWVLEIGHSRRGQMYYLLVDNEGYLKVVASKPDGDGGPVELPSVLMQMILEGIFE